MCIEIHNGIFQKGDAVGKLKQQVGAGGGGGDKMAADGMCSGLPCVKTARMTWQVVTGLAWTAMGQ